MNKRMRHESKIGDVWPGWVCVWVALVLNGCGKSDSPVVSPPVSEDVASADAVEMDPPGEIVLPPGAIPSPEAVEEPKSEGGLEMPAGATLPADSGQAANESGQAANDDSGQANSGNAESARVRYGSWEEIQAAAKSSGRITVVDLWSLGCEPCLKEFPGLVELHRSIGSSVQCVAVNLDFDGRKSRPPKYYEERVADFLASVAATGFPTYISRTPSDDVFAMTNLVSIPAVLIYDAKGELVKVFVDAGETAGFSYAQDVAPLVRKLAG